MIDAVCRPLSRNDILYRELDDGCILYDAANLNVYTLNATAAYIWNCCDGESDVKRMAEDMSQFCQIDLDVALEHVKSTIRQFHDSGLLVSMTRNHET